MTEEEFKSRISIRFRETEEHIIVLGEFVLQESYCINKHSCVSHLHEAKKEVVERVIEGMLRHVFEDRRREFYHLITELLRCDPYNLPEQQRVVDKLIKTFQRQ